MTLAICGFGRLPVPLARGINLATMHKYFPLLAIYVALLTGCPDSEEVSMIPPEPTQSEVMFNDVVTTELGDPLADVLLTVWADNERLTTVTDEAGEYRLIVGVDRFPTAGEIAMTFYKPGYAVRPVRYAAPLTGGVTYVTNVSSLRDCSGCYELSTAWMGDAFGLWHVGDDSYRGPSNSQFQKASDSDTGIRFEFTSAVTQPVRISFLGKGLDGDHATCNNNLLRINGGDVEIRDSPTDGSYGAYRFQAVAQQGSNVLDILTATCAGGDLDDWEFIGLTVEAL